ncbi:MAG: recombination factor protein RarA, partial [Steroidobacterales bacterium]
GYGSGYRYAHNEPEAFAAGERYLPEGMPERRYYEPAPRGLELKIGEALARLRERNQNARASGKLAEQPKDEVSKE